MSEENRLNMAPISNAAWPTELDGLRAGFATQLNVYRVMAHHPALLRSWVALRHHVVVENSLTPAALEIVVLRTGARRDAPYEWAHHVVRGRRAGLSDARIASTAKGRLPSDPFDLLLVRAVDELIDDARLSDGVAADLATRFGPCGVMDIVATVGMYTTLAFIVNSFDTPLDIDVAEKLARSPLVS